MELHTITELLKQKDKVVFGPKNSLKMEKGNTLGLYYIITDVKAKTIMFTSDNMDYIMSKQLEKAMEKLFSEFGITNYQVQLHIHKGDWHDKDVTVQLKDFDVLPKVIQFIQNNFYNKRVEWDFMITE